MYGLSFIQLKILKMVTIGPVDLEEKISKSHQVFFLLFLSYCIETGA